MTLVALNSRGLGEQANHSITIGPCFHEAYVWS